MRQITIKRMIKGMTPYGALVLYRRTNSLINQIEEYILRRNNINSKVSDLVAKAKVLDINPSPHVVVSLTSYGYRIKQTAPIAVASLLRQSVAPDKIILWLAHGEKVPSLLRGLGRYGLEIRYCEDLKSYKKLIPALEEYPSSVIITADDDVEYPEDWLSKLLAVHKKNPGAILTHRARYITVTERGTPSPYEEWPLINKNPKNNHLILPNGIGGVLYPPNSLSKEVFNKDLFMELAPSGDDLWFWAMGELKNTKRVLIDNGYQNISDYELDSTGLWNTINREKDTGTDAQFVKILKHYPKLITNIGATRALESDFSGSASYWEDRYKLGGNSGAGSYDNLADFKAEVINGFVEEHDINTVMEFGVGDGNQLLLANYPHFIGLDVSETAINMCKRLFEDDKTKEFYTLEQFGNQKAELTLSLDVLYHLIEQDVFESHIHRLFGHSTKYVIIYATDSDDYQPSEHVRSRKFTSYIKDNIKGWKLIEHIPNKYPYDESNPQSTSWADFYIYKKIIGIGDGL